MSHFTLVKAKPTSTPTSHTLTLTLIQLTLSLTQPQGTFFRSPNPTLATAKIKRYGSSPVYGSPPSLARALMLFNTHTDAVLKAVGQRWEILWLPFSMQRVRTVSEAA